MLDKKNYANGQKVYELINNKLTYFFKDGKIKAFGTFINDQMEGEWIFYRETGQLWQIGNFKNGMKHGSFIRYNRNDQIEYQETFEEDKIIKNKLSKSK